MPSATTVGLIGCGAWGRHILRDLTALGCSVPVVARSPESRAAATAGGAGVVSETVDALPAVDGVVVATPASTHAAVVRELLDRNVPIFVEKPLTVNSADADDLVRHGDGRVFVMDKWRYHPGVEALRDIAVSQELGPVVGLRLTRVGWGRQHPDVDAVWTLTPHDISIALEILGAIPTPRTAVMEPHGAGLVGILGHSPWCVIETSASGLEERREVRLVCRDGVAVLNCMTDTILRIARTPVSEGAPGIEERALAAELPLLRELRAFVDHLRGGPAPRSSVAEGAATVRTIASLRQLAQAAIA